MKNNNQKFAINISSTKISHSPLSRYVWWIASAVLLSLSFPNIGIPFLGFFALVPAIYRSYRDGYISVILGSLIFSLIFWVWTVDWFSSFHPLALLGILIPLYLYTMIPFVLFSAISKGRSEDIILAFPFLWSSMELLKGNGFWSLPLIYLSHSQYHFSLTDNYIFYVLNGAIPSLARLFGVFGVSFFVALINSLILIAILKFRNYKDTEYLRGTPYLGLYTTLLPLFVFFLTETIVEFSFTYTTLVVLSLIFLLTPIVLREIREKLLLSLKTYYPITLTVAIIILGGMIAIDSRQKYDSAKGEVIKFGLLQPNFSPWDKLLARDFEKLDEVIKLYKDAGQYADIVVGCESILRDPVNYYYKLGDDFGVRAMNIGKEVKKPIILTYPHRESFLTNSFILRDGRIVQIVSEYYEYYNSALFFDRFGNVITRYDKVHTVPFGEWTPFSEYIPPLRQAINAIVGGDLTPGREFKVVSVEVKPSIVINLAGIICFEDLYPYITKRLSLMGSDVIVNMTNDGWANSVKSQWQHLVGAIYRAIETGLPLLRATNTGRTAVILPYGLVISNIEDFTKGYIVEGVKIAKIKTFYTILGDQLFTAFLLLGSAFIILSSILRTTRS